MAESIVLCNRCDVAYSETFLQSHGAALWQDTRSKLRANHHPSPSEDDQTSQLLLKQKNILRWYDNEISRVKKVARKLERRRAEHQKLVAALQSLHSPIRRLPAECLAEIFYHVVRQTWKTPRRRSINVAPLVLGLVCTTWRDVALSNKGLWSYINVDADFVDDRISSMPRSYDRCVAETNAASRVEAVVQKYLELSHPVPLTLSMRAFVIDPDFRGVFALLASHAERWREAEVHMHSTLLEPGKVLATIQGRLPLLEELLLELQVLPAAPIRCFTSCPRLQTLTTVHNRSDHSTLPVLPLHQLTRLTADNTPVGALVKLVGSCPQLKDLTVKFSKHDLASDSDSDSDSDESEFESEAGGVIPSTHRFDIQSLNITMSHYTKLFELCRIYRAFTLPCLRSFSVTSRHSQAWPQELFVRMLERSSCPLETLCFGRIAIVDSELLDILRLVPTITTLQINECREGWAGQYPTITNDFLQALTHSSGEITLAPRLSHIDFTVGPYFDNTALFDMIESRWTAASVDPAQSGGIAALEFLRIHMMDGCTRLRELKFGGVKVVLQR